MKHVLLAAIGIYRRWVSPYKGYSCAYRVYAGGESCSAYGRRVIGRYGSMRGIGLLRRRMGACGDQYRFHRARLDRQKGDCDIPCGIPSCDLGDLAKPIGCCWDTAEVADCCDRKQRKRSSRACASLWARFKPGRRRD